MNLTKNFTLEELYKSATASRMRINNYPGPGEQQNLKQLCTDILQPIRDKYGKPIIITSGYRSKRLNDAIKGSKTSQHITGAAADLHSLSDTREENKKLFDLIVDMIKNKEIKVGQLINEHDYNWIHISLPYKRINQIFELK